MMEKFDANDRPALKKMEERRAIFRQYGALDADGTDDVLKLLDQAVAEADGENGDATAFIDALREGSVS